MALTTQLRVLIEGDAQGLINSLSKVGRSSQTAFSEVSRNAKQEFAAATKAADASYKEVARLQSLANRLDKQGQGGAANAVRSQAAARAQEGEQAAAAAVAAERKIQAEMAKTGAITNELTRGAANQGGAFSRFFGAITAGSGGSSKALGELKNAFTGLVSGGGISGLTNLASTGLKGLATGLGTAGKAGEEAAGGIAASGAAAEGATGGLAAMGLAGGGAAVGLLAGAAAVAVLGKTIESGTKHFLEYAGEIRGIQRLSGASAEQASYLAGQFRHLGIDVDAGSKALGRLAVAAETNSGKKLTDLGITIAHVGKSAKVDLLGTMENVGDAIRKVGPGAEASNIALRAFGRGGAVLLPLLLQTHGALKGINEETLKSGLVFSQEELNNAKELSLATRDVHHAFEGLQVSVAKGFAPVFTELTKGATGFLNTISATGDKVASPIHGMIDDLNDLATKAGNIGGGDNRGLLGRFLPKSWDSWDGYKKKANASAEAAQQLADKLQASATAGDDMAASFEAGSGLIIKASEATIGFKDALGGVAQSIADNGKAMDSNTDAGRKNIEASLKAATAAEQAGEAYGKQVGDFDKGTAAADRHRAVLLQLLSVQLGSGAAADKFAKEQLGMSDASITAAHGVHLTADELQQVNTQAARATDELKKFNDELDRTTGKNLSASDANIRYHQSLAEVQKQLLVNGDTFDLNTKAGQDNQSALNSAISGLDAYAKAEGDKTAAVDGASAGLQRQKSIIDEGTLSLIAMIAPMVGGTAQATLLVGALQQIPPKVAPEFSTPGLPEATTNVTTFAAAVEEARRKAGESAITVSYALHDPFNLRFGGGLGLPPTTGSVTTTSNFNLGRAEGGPAKKGIIYETAERGQELFVSTLRTPSAKSAAAHLAHQAGSAAQEGLVRLGIPAGIQRRSAPDGIPALLLGTHGPQMFTPPTDGVIVKASDTQRLKHTKDADVITDILKRAGLDRRSIDALTNVPHRGGGGSVRKDKTVLAGEQGGAEAFVPNFAMPHRATAPSIMAPGVKRGSDGSYNITIGDTHLKVEGVTSGSAKGVNKADVDKIVERKQAELVAELVAAMRSG